jgi:hypothetical protein
MFVSLIALLHSCKSIHSKLILKAHERTLIAYFIDYTRLRISTSLLSRPDQKRVNPCWSQLGKRVQLDGSYSNPKSCGRQFHSHSRSGLY